MKKIKRAAAFFLAAVMTLAMTCTAFAAEAKDFPDKPSATKEASMDGHTFTVYQIFTGTQDEDANELIDIDWGAGINGETFLTALKGSSDFEGENPFSAIAYDSSATFRSAQAVAKIVATWSPNGKNARTFASLAQKHLVGEGSVSYTVGAEDEATQKDKIPAGYYLVVDETNFGASDTDTVKNLSILQLTKEHEFTPENKTDIPELEKKVKEINDSEGTNEWKDAADYDIGDDVEFVLTGTLPTNYDDYKTYKYVFHDTLSAGLELNDDIMVYVQNGDTVTELSGYVVDKDVVKTGGDDVTGETTVKESFTVTFDNLKDIKSVTKDSVIRVAYTAKLTTGAIIGGSGNINEAYLEYSNDPNHDGSGTPPTGETPKDKVVVFTYQLLPNKVDEDGEALAGAGFSLYKKVGENYVPYEIEGVTTEKTDADGNIYYEIAGVTTFNFKGVDAGSYKLVETTVPKGYNKAEDMYFTIEATVDVKDNVTELKIAEVKGANGQVIQNAAGEAVFEFAADKTAGSLTTDIVNLQGVVLPSTGGIGTTIFYVVGAIMVLGAGVLLVTKKRMSRTK